MKEKISNYLSQFNLDVRISKDARFVDQKCTPDILCFIADCIINLPSNISEFTVATIWESDYFKENTTYIFHKPNPAEESAHNEYNKVLSQPLKLLAYAHVLKVCKKKQSLVFSVENFEILDFISRNDKNARIFLVSYLKKVMQDSGFWRYFDEYKEKCRTPKRVKVAREQIYERYRKFISGHTKTKSKLDINRIFHKVFNIFAVEYNIPGSKGKVIQNPQDLNYNNTNLRDVNKLKTQTRSQAKRQKIEEKEEILKHVDSYLTNKAIRMIHKIQATSEVDDRWRDGTATHAHHIFPKSVFPQLAHYLENLIMLTPTQHNVKAHPDNNTQIVSLDYQYACLIAKSKTIENSLQLGESYYSKENFIFVIKTGYSCKKSISSLISFSDLRLLIKELYEAA